MRTLVELFKVIKANEHLLHSGLCRLTTDLYLAGKIDNVERERLREYLAHNRPGKDSKYHNIEMETSAWYWPLGKWYPRLLWINAQIRELSKPKSTSKTI